MAFIYISFIHLDYLQDKVDTEFLKCNWYLVFPQVRDFALAVQEEEDTVVYGGTVQAPKVLADIVESVAAAIYVDCQYDLQALWVVSSPVIYAQSFQQFVGKKWEILVFGKSF